MSPAPAPYVKEMNDAGQFYTNRVLKDWKDKSKLHVDWVKTWIQTLTEIQVPLISTLLLCRSYQNFNDYYLRYRYCR